MRKNNYPSFEIRIPYHPEMMNGCCLDDDGYDDDDDDNHYDE